MLMFNKRRGISLVEVTIVLAISGLMLVIAISTFSMRAGVAVDDAAKQVESAYQKAHNEAVQGLGSTNNHTFSAGDELFGQAIQFRNFCSGSQSCLTVFKLKKSSSNVVSSYETYDVPLREGLEFGYLVTDCSFVSCYQAPGASMRLLSEVPISMATGQVPMIVTKNGNGGSYLFASMGGSFGVPDLPANINNYVSNRQGTFQLSLFRRDSTADTSQTALHRYFLNFNLATGGVTIQKP